MRLRRRRFLAATAGAAITLADLGRARAARPARLAAADAPPDRLRVLLRRSGGSVDAAAVRVSGEGAVAVRDLAGDGGASAAAGEVVTIGQDGGRLWLQVGDGKRSGPFDGPLRVAADDDGARLGHHADGAARPIAYRGTLEVARSTRDGHVTLLNVLDLDDYLAGVVPGEMPAAWGSEPARAQAVAARSFALARSRRGTHAQLGADVCDSVDCQVYGGAAHEQPLASEAVAATRGTVLRRGGVLLEPFYCSTCGGHTEASARLFGAGAAGPVANAHDAVPDGELPAGADLTSEEGSAAFCGRGWGSHCSASNRYRWRVQWERRRLEEILDAGLRRLAGSRLVEPAPSAQTSIGTLTNLVAAERGLSGRVLALRVEGSNGTWTVRRDWTIRDLLRAPSDGAPLASTAFVLERAAGADGKLAGLTAVGAGWGHGVGMCQWGARGLAAQGRPWEAILAHYYPGTDLGPPPR